MDLLTNIKNSARQLNKTIVLPEGTEERTLKAADELLKERLASIILLGNKQTIEQNAAKWKLEHVNQATVIDPENNPQQDYYADMLVEIRKKKGLTKKEALKLVTDPLYLATLLIKDGQADGEVAGADNATGDVLRPAFQIVKTLPGISIVSGAFFMIFKDCEYAPDNILVFADCAVHPDPDAQQLAEIAVSTAKTAKDIGGLDPKVALLSFSTKGSAQHELVDKVAEATRLAQEKAPDMAFDGELQSDAAIVENIAAKKAPQSQVAGKANVLVFPSLETGNISYKLVERLAGVEAVGPVLQGMAAPINDLSRGCSVSDIVNLVAITANQAEGMKNT
ncbi:MAG: phosphate acetyltransferase [Bacteroidales bacterium]|nr:phosphate acetyltransferase [Bacteroidales bacterium]MCF8334439.1 phosphate acetyltransferase [Bacteroidales bacterium]